MSKSLLHHWSGRRLRTALFAAASGLALTLSGCGGGSSSTGTTELEAFLDTQVAQIGGATTAVAYTTVTDTTTTPSTTTEWALYSMANRLASRQINTTPDATFGASVKEITLPGYIQHITPVSYDDGAGVRQYALVSMGGKGLAVVDITNPGAMVHLRTVSVNYLKPAYDYSDGGGTVFTSAATDPAAPLTNGPVNDVLVDDKGTPADTSDDELFIANGAFGIQKALLSTVMSAANGAALTDTDFLAQAWTLKYAGENPWGGPLSLKMHGGKLYAALGFLGMGIYDPATLARTKAYNLYADCPADGNAAQEDWFGYPNLKPKCNTALLVDPGYIDADGMPTYQQAAAELTDKSGTTVTNYPWAQFDRYGKYYYNALAMDVQDIGGKTIAYIAYALGGLVAVDVTGTPTYLGYVPASPAHGPDEPTGQGSSKSILSYHGAGMLKDAGVKNVRVVDESGTGAGPYRAYYTDHFAGLVVVGGADNPAANWKNGGGNFNNDSNPATFWPDYEFVKSYDMTPVLVGDEAIPKFLTADGNGNYTAPVMLATGELNGHGGAFFMLPGRNTAGPGQIDVVEASGAGGVSFVDIQDLSTPGVAVASRFGVPVQLVSTNEVGADGAGAAAQMMAIGHAEGLAVSGNYLYLADGPHGVSVWSLANDNIHVVANTLQSEYPAVVGSETIYPAPHAFSVAFGSDPTKAFVMNQSVGLRKVDVSAVTGGTAKVGAPSLLKVFPADIYEHSTEDGGNLGGINGQDHTYGVAFYGKYAIVADGGNGLTVYDVTIPADSLGTHIVANLGGTTTGQAPLGRAAAVKLWTNPANGRIYAVVAAGSSGISVVDMTDLLLNGIKPGMTLIKTFEPMKSDADNPFGSADGKSVDVQIVGDYAYISYDSFGIVAYTMASLIQPVTETNPPVVPAGQLPGACASVTDVTKLSPNKKNSGGLECRPTAVARYKLQADPLHPEYAGLDGGAQHMRAQQLMLNTRLVFYVAYSDAGVLKLDWTDPANPKLMQLRDTVGSAGAVAVANGRVYVSDGTGGLVVFK